MTEKDLKDMEAGALPNENLKEDEEGNRGPTIVMQGVSGKRITADVKMIKVKKKSASKTAADDLTDYMENTAATADHAEQDTSDFSDASNKQAEEQAPETAASSNGPADGMQGGGAEASKEPKYSSNSLSEYPNRTNENKNPELKDEAKGGNKHAKTGTGETVTAAATAPTDAQSSTANVSEKPTMPNAVHESAAGLEVGGVPTATTETLAGSTAGTKTGEDNAAQANSDEPTKLKQDNKAASAANRSKRPTEDNRQPDSNGHTVKHGEGKTTINSANVSKENSGENKGGEVTGSAATADMTRGSGKDTKNETHKHVAGTGTTAQPNKPVNPDNPAGAERKVGAVVDPAKSALAATAARFAAQAAARKKAAEQRAKASSQRSNSPANYGNRRNGQGAGNAPYHTENGGNSANNSNNANNGNNGSRGGNGYGGNRNGYSNGNAGSNGGYRQGGYGSGRGGRSGLDMRFAGKDKDSEDEPKLQSHSRKQPAKRPAFEVELLNNSREASRSAFATRDSAAGKKNDYRHKDGDNLRNRITAKRRNNEVFDDSEFERGRRNRVRNKKEAVPAPVIHAVLTNVSLPEMITVKELAEALKKTSAEVIKVLMKMGVMATLNQELDYDTASIIAGEFNIQTEKIVEVTEEDILFDDSDDKDENLETRPPVVCVMGHVDHGKTSLLDYIRNSSVAHGEAGGITQHIGAYMVNLNGRKITFLDTPGHEAFTTMRARGAQATDIAILVVAADDGVMPQTIEAINHAKAANTQIVVAINKIDRPGANPERVKEELAAHELIPEEWGGSTVMVPVSAKTGEGVAELLEMVLLTADILDLKANPNRQAKGIVIEAKLDKQRGPVATLLVKRGTLHTGDSVVMGDIFGHIRAMTDARGKTIKQAGPSVPVEIIGLPGVPEAGETFYQVADEKTARVLAEKRRIKNREASIGGSSRMSLDNLFSRMAAGEVKELNLIIKADVNGSVEAVDQAMQKLSNDEVKVNIVHSGVGAITESDIRLAEVSNAIVIGFNVRPSGNVADQAKDAGVDVRLYRVIYNAIDDVEAAMKGMLAPKVEEVNLGQVEIRQVFRASNIGTIGGGYVTSGKIQRNCMVRLVRDGVQIWDGKLASLKRFKDDVKEVAQGYECGLSLENYNDIKEGDVIEAYAMQEVERE